VNAVDPDRVGAASMVDHTTQNFLWEFSTKYAAALAVALTLWLWKWFRGAVKAVVTKHPPKEMTRRELMVLITGCCAFGFIFSALIFRPLVGLGTSGTEPPVPLIWPIVGEAIIVGLALCYAVLHTPKEKQSGLLRYGAILSVVAASICMAAFGFTGFGDLAPTGSVIGRTIAIAILGFFLGGTVVTGRALIREQRSGAIKALPITAGDVFRYFVTITYVSLGLGSFLAWYFRIPQVPGPRFMTLVLKYSWPLLFLAVVILIINVRKQSGIRRIMGYVAAVLWSFSTCIVGTCGISIIELTTPSARVIQEAKAHPGFVVVEIDGAYEHSEIPDNAIKAWWETDPNGRITLCTLNPKYTPRHLGDAEESLNLITYRP
jgi:hypothetical protein